MALVFMVAPSGRAPNSVIRASAEDSASAINADPQKGAASINEMKRRRAKGWMDTAHLCATDKDAIEATGSILITRRRLCPKCRRHRRSRWRLVRFSPALELVA